MTLILLIWYSLGVACVGIAIKHDDEICLKTFLVSLLLTPFMCIIIAFMLLADYGDKIIWRKP